MSFRIGKPFIVFALSLALAACGKTAEQQVRTRERAASWVATARTVAGAWNVHDVSTAFARDTLDEARTGLSKLLPDLEVPARREAEKALPLLGRMRDALVAREESRVRAMDEPLSAAERALRQRPAG